MPKHNIFSRKVTKPEVPVIHPMWRGIGCVFMAIIPILSYIAANILIDNASSISWIVIPPEMILSNYTDPLILIRILYTAIISLILFFIISLTTFILNSIINPKRKGPHDL